MTIASNFNLALLTFILKFTSYSLHIYVQLVFSSPDFPILHALLNYYCLQSGSIANEAHPRIGAHYQRGLLVYSFLNLMAVLPNPPLAVAWVLQLLKLRIALSNTQKVLSEDLLLVLMQKLDNFITHNSRVGTFNVDISSGLPSIPYLRSKFLKAPSTVILTWEQ